VHSRRDVWIGTLGLAVIVGCCAFVVMMTADRPSVLSPVTHTGFFPRWMAGPLGGLWPSLTRNGTIEKDYFTGAMVLMYVAYIAGIRFMPSLPLRTVVGAIVIVHLILVLAPPMALTDVFNYINYGRMEIVDHLNPYTTTPIYEPHTDPSFALSNWHQLLSPYGPLFTMLTFLVVPLGVGGSFWALKVILCVTSLGTLFLIYRCAQHLGRNPTRAIVIAGLNPIVLIWGLGGDHNDFLMMFMIVLALYLLLRARERTAGREPPSGGLWGWVLPISYEEVGAGVALVTAVAIKASAAVLIPVVLAALLKAPRRLIHVLLGMAGATLVVGAMSLIAFGLHIPDLSTQGNVVTNESIPNLIGLALGAGGETNTLHLILSGVLGLWVLACARFAFRRRGPGEGSTEDAIARLIDACGWASVALLVLLSWVLPWYVLWVLPLAALSRSRRLRTTALALGAYLIIAWSPASGLLWKAIDFHPEKTALGRLHQRYVKELLN
jgi:hypothetical protein